MSYPGPHTTNPQQPAGAPQYQPSGGLTPLPDGAQDQTQQPPRREPTRLLPHPAQQPAQQVTQETQQWRGQQPAQYGQHPAQQQPATQLGQDVLTGRGLVKFYGDVVGLAGVDVAVRAGEALAVMGPSGNGKTTLLHVLAGILTPDQGEIWLAGERVDQMNDAARTVLRRRRLGFVFQDNQLLAELPADENVALPLMVDGVSRREAIGRCPGHRPSRRCCHPSWRGHRGRHS